MVVEQIGKGSNITKERSIQGNVHKGSTEEESKEIGSKAMERNTKEGLTAFKSCPNGMLKILYFLSAIHPHSTS